jgi:hypothetical protein
VEKRNGEEGVRRCEKREFSFIINRYSILMFRKSYRESAVGFFCDFLDLFSIYRKQTSL